MRRLSDDRSRVLAGFIAAVRAGRTAVEAAGRREALARYYLKRATGMTVRELRASLANQPHDTAVAPAARGNRDGDAPSEAVHTPVLPGPRGRRGRPRRTYERLCPGCGQPFRTKKVGQMHCSHRCANMQPRRVAAHNSRSWRDRTCDHCGRLFRTARAEQRYCSNPCRIRCISVNKTRLGTIACPVCGDSFRQRQRRVRFCSRRCALLGRRSSGFVRGEFSLSDGRRIPFDSSYELAFLLYANDHAQEFREVRRCDFTVPYAHGRRNYHPDFVVVTAGGPSLVEIKATCVAARDPRLRAKLRAARRWCAAAGWTFMYLTDKTPGFRGMCSYVAQHHKLTLQLHSWDSFQRRSVTRTCVKCRRVIPRRGRGLAEYGGRKYCSRACMSGPRKRVERVCPSCKRTFAALRGRVYCCKQCYSAAMRSILPRDCPVCGRPFRPKSSALTTCSAACGIVYRSARRAGRSVSEEREFLRVKRESALALRRTPRIENWTHEAILTRLRVIREYLGGAVPSYSQLYRNADLRRRFNSCALAGAIFRFDQKHGIASYGEFVLRHLKWTVPTRLTRETAAAHLGAIVERFGGVPTGIRRMSNVLGVRGSYYCKAFWRLTGMSVRKYCRAHGIPRV
jgi:hypothetical protein